MSRQRYTRVREIGRGGMGTVWLGQDHVLGRTVAMKRVGMLPGTGSPDLARAEREARLAAALSHPHVVAVFDLVDEGDGQWLVMEYVDGASLAEVVRREGPLSEERAAAILWQVADALSVAHGAGIVHRDVKPSNILVTEEGQAKLTDFGIARAEADHTLTSTGLVTGSPAYLSPEVASGSSATPASDVWALGATLYHCLEGTPPYDVSDNLLGTMYQIVHEPPPRTDRADRLARLLEHTMTQDPTRRWTAARVREHLRTLEEPDSTQQLPAPAGADLTRDRDGSLPAERSPTPGAQHDEASSARRWPWAVLGVVVLVASIVAFSLGMNAGRVPQAQDPAPQAGASVAPNQPSPAESDTTNPDSPSVTPTEGETISAEEMESFVVSYLDTVTRDPREAWGRLTPAFQEESGGIGSFQGFWRTIAEAEVSNVQADPSSGLVSYDVTYTIVSGDRRSDSPTLRLVRQDGQLKIAGES